MRHTVWTLGLFVLGVACAARRGRLLKGCEYQRYVGALETRPMDCRATRDAIEQVETQIMQQSACSTHTKEQARKQLQYAHEYIGEMCQEGGLQFAVCQHQPCLELLKIPGNCGSIVEGMQCAETQVIQNPDCTPDVKFLVTNHTQKAQGYMAVNCDGSMPAGQRPVPPGEPPVPNPAMPAVEPPVPNPAMAAVEPPMPNPSMPAVEPPAPNPAVQADQSPLPNPTTPAVCDYQKCLDILAYQQVNCGTVKQVRQCAETHIFTNAVCSQRVISDVRSQLQHEEQYLHCLPGAAVMPPPPAAAVTPPPPPAAAPVCRFLQCFDLLEQFEFSCGIAIDVIRCSRSILQNHACPHHVKQEADNNSQQAQAFFRDQCEEYQYFIR